MRLNRLMTACDPSLASSTGLSRKGLEIIVTSREEAIEAEQGGADRLEVVRSLEKGGLTPLLESLESILPAVRIPVRVMLRETDSMTIANAEQLDRLTDMAHRIAQFPIEGLVIGYLESGRVDERALGQILSAAPGMAVTFHRAFEHLQVPLAAISVLKKFPQIDRILIRVRDDDAGINLAQAKQWQHFAAPNIRFILGIGLGRTLLPAIRNDADFCEVHVGRGAREPETTFGAVVREKIAGLKSALL